MITINLIKEPSAGTIFQFPKELKLEHIIAPVVVLSIVGVLFWHWNLGSQKDEYLEKRTELQEQSLQLATIRNQVKRFEEQKTQLTEKADVIDQLRNSQHGPVQLMNAIISSVPEEPRLWLTKLNQQDSMVTIQGKAFDVPAIADFVANLDRKKPFRMVDLNYWEEGDDCVEFELSCSVGAE